MPVQGPPQGLEIAPAETLLQRLAQEIGRVQRRQGTDLAPILGLVGEPAAAGAQDALLDAEQVLGRGPAEAEQEFRAASSICRAMNGLQMAISWGVGVRLPGGRQGTMLAT